MTHDTKIFDDIKHKLLQQKHNLQTMFALLDEELDAVKKRDGKLLLAVSGKKEQLLTTITQLDQQLSGDNNKQHLNSTPELKQLHDEITQLLTDCQQKNEVVYLSATQNQVAIDEVKRLLIGGSKNTTYDAYGKKQSGGSLGKGIKA